MPARRVSSHVSRARAGSARFQKPRARMNEMMKRILTIAGVAAMGACTTASAGSGTAAAPAPGGGDVRANPGVQAAAGTITAAEMREHIAYLASDALRG